MSDEIDREITTRKVTSNSNTPVNEYRVSEQRTSQVRNDDNSNGLILGILLVLAVGAGAAVYFMNNRPAPTQILVPANNNVKENKSTVIERNNTTIREVAPATTQPTPRVEINVPSSAPQPAPRVEINVPPAPAVTTQPQPATTSSPAATAQPQTTVSPRPTN